MLEWLMQDPKGQWALFLAVVGGVFFVTRWFYKHDAAHIVIENAIDGLKDRLAGIEASVTGLSVKLDKALFKASPAGLFASSSPLQLTEKVKAISGEIGAKGLAERIAPHLHPSMSGLSPFDIQERCYAYFLGGDARLPDDEQASFKRVAFENGLELEHLHIVCAIELRDVLLRLQGEPASVGA